MVRKTIAQFTDWDINVMTAIAEAENTACDPLRHNLSSTETHYSKGEVYCVGSYGVLQVGCIHYREGENPDDIDTNVKVAHRVWLSQGYNAWTQYREGVYLRYLK